MEAGYRAGRQQRVDPRGWKFLGGGGVTPSPTPTIPPRGYYKVNLANREIDNIIAILDPNGGEEGAVKLYIPTSSIPQDTAQAVDVFYVDETGLVDSFSLIVPERAGTFLADLAAEAEPQVKAAYEGVNQVNSDTYLVDTAAKIRTDGVTPLPSAPKKGLFKRDTIAGGMQIIVTSTGKVVLLDGATVIESVGENQWAGTNPDDYRAERESWGEEAVESSEISESVYIIRYDNIEYTLDATNDTLTPSPEYY